MMLQSSLLDAVRYWELRRIAYNIALTALATAVVIRTWPHFEPAFTPQSVPPLVVLALLANLCYCAAYGVEFLVQQSGIGKSGRLWRPILWSVGTLLALLFEYYWIMDEIYPAVPFVP